MDSIKHYDCSIEPILSRPGTKQLSSEEGKYYRAILESGLVSSTIARRSCRAFALGSIGFSGIQPLRHLDVIASRSAKFLPADYCQLELPFRQESRLRSARPGR